MRHNALGQTFSAIRRTYLVSPLKPSMEPRRWSTKRLRLTALWRLPALLSPPRLLRPKRQIALSLHLQPNPRKSIPVPYRLPPQRSRSRREGERHPLRRGIMTESSGKHGSVGWSGNSKMARYVGVDALD